MSSIYYKAITTIQDPSKLTVVCLQHFDEVDYDQNRFLKHKGTNIVVRFNTEEEMLQFLYENVKLEHLDDEIRKSMFVNTDHFYK